ncbi:hypothetical protein MPNT_90026 [Candidatus Methylacidithermus pantelleriae]|uniref:Uncharacterized protein n=1 Tax=Candidatus Methylacidithermus pantelleriae TaxID=2744239 RepID=A0A8J2FPV5_9BACT|nr:hypothetical protein MPNT_90026 [Candidatus Methylacidithermus pantelleriae]
MGKAPVSPNRCLGYGLMEAGWKGVSIAGVARRGNGAGFLWWVEGEAFRPRAKLLFTCLAFLFSPPVRKYNLWFLLPKPRA